MEKLRELLHKFALDYYEHGSSVDTIIPDSDINPILEYIKNNFVPLGAEVSGKFTAEDEVILKSLVMLKILEAQQAIDNSIFSENGTQKVLYKKKEELKTILSKFSR